MRTTRTVIETRHFAIRAVECTDDHPRWSAPEPAPSAHIVLVQRGHFRVEVEGRKVTAEPATGYLHLPGEELRFAHPAGGDVCTAVTLSDDELTDGELTGGELTGDELTGGVRVGFAGAGSGSGSRSAGAAARSRAVRVDARLELAHRLLLRSGGDPGFAAAEAVLDLVRLALREQPHDTPPPGRADLAERAREAVLADPLAAASLVELARLLDTSPSHLSHTFRHHVGMPVSRYRNRVRVSRALARLDQGETDLAALATGLGFSDQAHLTRVMRAELGHTPGRVRALLAS